MVPESTNNLALINAVRHEPRTDEAGNKVLYLGPQFLALYICFAIIFVCVIVMIVAGIASNYQDSLSDTANMFITLGLFLVLVIDVYFVIAAMRVRVTISDTGIAIQGRWPFKSKSFYWSDIAKISHSFLHFTVRSSDGAKIRIPIYYYGIHKLVRDFKSHLVPDVYREAQPIINTINFMAMTSPSAAQSEVEGVVPVDAQTAALPLKTNNMLWEKSKRLSIVGLISVFGGLSITLTTLYFARNGGTYQIMWGLVAVGLYYAVSGIYNLVKSNAAPALRYKWVIGSVAVLIVLVSAGIYSYTQIDRLRTPPSNSAITLDNQSKWIDISTRQLNGNFIIANTDSRWSISNVVVKYTVADKDGKVLNTYDIHATPQTISPGSTGAAKEVIQIPMEAVDDNIRFSWTWVAP